MLLPVFLLSFFCPETIFSRNSFVWNWMLRVTAVKTCEEVGVTVVPYAAALAGMANERER